MKKEDCRWFDKVSNVCDITGGNCLLDNNYIRDCENFDLNGGKKKGRFY